jgi:hypothetical protein
MIILRLNKLFLHYLRPTRARDVPGSPISSRCTVCSGKRRGCDSDGDGVKVKSVQHRLRSCRYFQRVINS